MLSCTSVLSSFEAYTQTYPTHTYWIDWNVGYQRTNGEVYSAKGINLNYGYKLHFFSLQLMKSSHNFLSAKDSSHTVFTASSKTIRLNYGVSTISRHGFFTASLGVSISQGTKAIYSYSISSYYNE